MRWHVKLQLKMISFATVEAENEDAALAKADEGDFVDDDDGRKTAERIDYEVLAVEQE